ncbi:Aerobic respiration control sensor protein ArcB [Variovorax sp. PBL-H6]|uniref:hybrid sensor histidine kinase/response regulator n=1 Tax=Variovorax sp. PBL-H6 TaxID=434009 RepID=UPI0013161E5A|nr:hybrid sensor histidine kinase/response regulator [Variovorax sp. PBL-H6]VTU37328.1 Aerobic respiration control sensor protein ArcB [Variovorax sp. PBL-H6]
MTEAIPAPMPLSAASRDARIGQRVLERRLQLILQYSRRLPLNYLGYILVAFIVWRQGVEFWPWAWLVLTGAVMVYRWRMGLAVERAAPDRQLQCLPRLLRGFDYNGVSTASIVPFAFYAHGDFAPMAVAAVLMAGCTIGAASVAGSQRAFVGFCTLTFCCLAAGWAWRGGAIGYMFAAGILLVYFMLLATVKDQGRMLHKLMNVLDDNAVLSEAVRQERDRATAASEAKTRFFAAASHDLRQPLHALSINATTLDILARRSSDPLLKEVSRGIASALRQSSGLLDGLLDISRLDAHTTEARFAPHDIGAVLRASRDEYAALAAQQGIFLKAMVPKTPLWGLTDADQLIRIVGNLVNNAIKFTTRGGVTLSAEAADDGRVLVRVSDSGPGIPEHERERVFEEFYQIGNPSRDRSQGLGLGLAIVRRTAELLKIEIKLDSEPGRGTTFTLHLAPAMPLDETHPEAATAQARASDGTRLAVLLVDDEAEVLSAMCTYLHQLGWLVKGVSTGAKALQALAEGFEPDVVVVDYRLRDETGLDVIARVRQQRPALPAVIVTGETAPSRFQEFSTAVARILHKPLDGDKLARTLQEVVLALDEDEAQEPLAPR